MTTITFKVADADARQLRQRARRERISLSELLRRQLFDKTGSPPVTLQRCAHTGAAIFGPAPHLPPLSTESVREILADFP